MSRGPITEAVPPTTRPKQSTRLTFAEDVVIRRPVAEVFAYVSDFNDRHQWRSEVVESSMQPAGPMQLGSRLHEVAIVGRRRVVTESVIDSFEPGHRFTFAHLSGPLPVSGEFRVDEASAGARLTYTLNVDLSGRWRAAAPYLRWSGRRTIRRSLDALRLRLENGSPRA